MNDAAAKSLQWAQNQINKVFAEAAAPQAIRPQTLTPTQAIAVQESVGGWIVQAVKGQRVGMTREEAEKTAKGMLASGFPSVGIYKLHSLMELEGK